MRRRQFVSLVGAGLATVGLTGVASADPGRTPPNENVDNTEVYPFGWTAPKDDPKQVNTGEWITHTLSWIDAGDEESERDDVERWLEAVEMTAWIDGEKVEDAEQYWGDVQYNEEEEAYFTRWENSTPPKGPGLYSFTIEHYYPDGYESDGVSREPGTRNEFTGYYEVVSGKGKKK